MTAGEVWTLVLSGVAALAFIGVPLSAWAVCLQRRAERRALEARDVVWSATRYVNDDNWYFKHSGSTDALEVKIDLTIDGMTSTIRFDRVPPDEAVEVRHTWHSELIEQAAAEDRRYDREVERSTGEVNVGKGLLGGATMPASLMFPTPIPPIPLRVEASFVVTWRSPLGVPNRQERTWTETY